MQKTSNSPSQSDASVKAAQNSEHSAAEDVKPPESAENFEHVIRRFAIARQRLRHAGG